MGSKFVAGLLCGTEGHFMAWSYELSSFIYIISEIPWRQELILNIALGLVAKISYIALRTQLTLITHNHKDEGISHAKNHYCTKGQSTACRQESYLGKESLVLNCGTPLVRILAEGDLSCHSEKLWSFSWKGS